MSETLISLIIAEIARQTPSLAIDIIEALNKGGTEEDWAELRKRWDRPADSFFKTPPEP